MERVLPTLFGFVMRHPPAQTIQFGTSGLRGPALGFTPQAVAAYVGAFLETTVSSSGKKTVYVGADFRDSSPQITAACISAIKAQGWNAVYAGNVPTPALALYAMNNNCPAIMVTGSHIPETYNGIKFYRRDGELRKEDEAPIKERATLLMQRTTPQPASALPTVASEIARQYVKRFTTIFAPDALTGMRIGIDMHSAVGRDLLLETLETLGATCFPFRRSQTFIAVDTEALSSKDSERALQQIDKHQLDCVVSTDGDGDRPLLMDENGEQINGDILGALTAKILGIETLVTPLSSTSAIEQSNWFDKVIRTKIGSPYVVAAMENELQTGKSIAGFEANGGFLVAGVIELVGGTLTALPTRDAMLPLISVLCEANASSNALSSMTNRLPKRSMQADRIQNISASQANEFLNNIQKSNDFRASLNEHLSNPLEINTQDGIRLALINDSIVHFRQSGNAPEMRIYVETGDRDTTRQTLNLITSAVETHLNTKAINQ